MHDARTRGTSPTHNAQHAVSNTQLTPTVAVDPCGGRGDILVALADKRTLIDVSCCHLGGASWHVRRRLAITNQNMNLNPNYWHK